jgi:uncharacterized protein (DUF2345 family)
MENGSITVTAGTAVITIAIDDGITIESRNANVTLTANEQTLKAQTITSDGASINLGP